MIDYLSQAVIYIIKCKDINIDDSYIGSSDSMKQRERNHRNCKAKYKLYTFVEANGGWDNFEFFMLEQYKAMSNQDLRKREGEWVNMLRPSLNEITPSGEFGKFTFNVKKKKVKITEILDNPIIVDIANIKDNKIICVCGITYQKKNRIRHEKTKRHIKNSLKLE